MDTVSMLIKPASGSCNLRCRYCFYHDVSEKRTEHNFGFMSEETLELLIKEAFENAEKNISFAFQGGEPMLRGLPFFEKFITYENKYMKSGVRAEHSIQTNATLITEEWADFFQKNHFLVGVSIDGRQMYHDRCRIYPDGSGSFETVKSSLSLLQKKGVETNALCVVTADIARHPKAAYRGLKALGCRYIQFIPCLDPLGEERAALPFSLTPELYGTFLNSVFDLYYEDWKSGDYVSVRLFDDYIHLLVPEKAGACATAGTCGSYFVIEADGSIYPCDFFVVDRFKMGQLGEQPLDELLRSPVSENFRKTGNAYPPACEGCKYLPLCNGGCRRDWTDDGRNYHCKAFQSFFSYAGPRLTRMAALERRFRRDL